MELDRNEYVTATGQSPLVEDDFGNTTYAIVNPDVLTTLTNEGGRFGPFNLGTTTNPQPGEVSIEGNNRAVLGAGASWNDVVTIVEDTQDFTGQTTATEHQILVVVDNDNYALFDVDGDTSDANHLDFVTVTERSAGVIGQPFHVYLSTDNTDVADYFYNNSFSFWANIEDVKSRLNINSGKRMDQEEIIVVAESRDVANLDIGDTIQWEGSDKTYQVNDIFDSEFKFMTTIIANYAD